MDFDFDTKVPGFTLRMATPGDAALILQFIIELAAYEHLEDQVVATEEGVRQSVFENHQADVLIGEFEGEPVSFTVIYYPYSTFIGGVYLYLEDLYVKEAYRNRGFGKAIFRALAAIAVQKGLTRVEWWCLDWNENSIEFYKSLGAVPKREFVTFRLDGDALKKLGES